MLALRQDFVDEVLRGSREDQTGEAVDRHQRHAEQQTVPRGPDYVAGIAQQSLEVHLLRSHRVILPGLCAVDRNLLLIGSDHVTS